MTGARCPCRGFRRAIGVSRVVLHRATDLAQEGRDGTAQEEQGDDRDDRDEGEDQDVFSQTLAFVPGAKRCNECGDEVRHGVGTSFPFKSPVAIGRGLRSGSRWPAKMDENPGSAGEPLLAGVLDVLRTIG
jgi:hypothetical protein